MEEQHVVLPHHTMGMEEQHVVLPYHTMGIQEQHVLLLQHTIGREEHVRKHGAEHKQQLMQTSRSCEGTRNLRHRWSPALSRQNNTSSFSGALKTT